MLGRKIINRVSDSTGGWSGYWASLLTITNLILTYLQRHQSYYVYFLTLVSWISSLVLLLIRNYEKSMMVSAPVAAVTGFLRPLAGDVAAGTFKQF